MPMIFFSRKIQRTQTRKPLRQIIWNAQLPEIPQTIVPEVLGPDRPRARVPVSAGYLDIDVPATEVPMTPDYSDPDFRALWSQLLEAGWDLPAKSAIALMTMPQPEHRTLEQQFLADRYRREFGGQRT